MSARQSDAHPSRRWRSVGDLLDRRAAETPDALALALPGNEVSYAQLARSSTLAARRLLGAGVRHGDRVGVLLREASAAYVANAIGALRIGALCVTVNARNRVRELEHVVRHSGMRLLLTSEEFREPAVEAIGAGACRVVILGADAAFDAGAARFGEHDVAASQARVRREDAALLLYTSGTTAEAKGCLHPHATMLAEGESCAERLRLSAGERFWTPLPLFHVGGWQVLMSTLSRGACFSHPGVFEAGAALEQLERERCAVAFPAFELIWMSVLEHPRFAEADLTALRAVMNVGVPERLLEMQQRTPRAIQVSCFGMTESFGSICIGALDDSLRSRTHSSGRPLPGIEVRVVAVEDGAEAPDGEPGELWFRGVTRFAGYYADPDATSAALDADGWYRSGDLVRREPDGSIVFVSRLKDMLKVGGENVSAADIEGYLLTHPAIATAAVVAARDARYGEVPAAFIQLAPARQVSEREVIEFCAGRIATYKVPRYVRVVERYPLTPTQKIQKHVLRERIERELNGRGVDAAPRIEVPGHGERR